MTKVIARIKTDPAASRLARAAAVIAVMDWLSLPAAIDAAIADLLPTHRAAADPGSAAAVEAFGRAHGERLAADFDDPAGRVALFETFACEANDLGAGITPNQIAEHSVTLRWRVP